MSKGKRAVFVVVGAVILATAGLILSMSSGAVVQPIAFNHRLHVEEVGLECTDCHLFAETGVRATIPNLDTCSGCHEEAAGESPEEARLVEIIQSGEPIPWKKVYRVPEHVYFSHRRHTAIAEIECEVCHGPIGEREQPVTRPAVAVTMDGCMDCHYETGATNDCIACHR